VDKNEFYGNFHPKCFFSFAVTLFARPKKLDAGDHGCFASPSYDEQVIVGRKVVLIGFFGNLRRRFLIKSPCRAPLAHPHAKKLHQLLLHAPGAPTNKISSGDEISIPLASFQIGSIITVFPRGLKRVKHPSRHRRPAANLLPEPPP